jgi:ATP-binding cassette subfamily B protein
MFAIMPIIRLFNQIGYVIIAGLGAAFVIQGKIPIGRIMSFFQYVQMSAEPLTEASFVLNSLQSAIASAERVFEILDEEEDVPDSKSTRKIKVPKGDITFEDVQFGYGKELLMDGVNFEVKAGQKVAIVGPTGAGKTTLVNLLMRFYELRGGSIKVDGVDTKSFERHYLRSLFGMVLQDSWMLDGTISDNIAYGRPKASRSEIVNAARMARADYFIRTMPQGYETVMNDETATLSQGEKQLICIARAILANSPILLLDEATSSVDTRTEVQIQKAMDNLMRGKTSFIIAHRLSTIKNADIILVMDQGNIVETGSHDELLEKGGMYSEIYNSQFAS